MKKLIIFLMTAVLMVSFFAGCQPQNGADKGEKRSEVKCGFTAIKELQAFEYSTNFYKASLNTEKDYITEGDTSARFYFNGKEFEVSEMKIYSDTKYFGSKDFSKVNMITLDVFNTDSVAHTFTMSFSTSVEGQKQIYQKYTEKLITVQPGYTLVTYPIDQTVAHSICDMKYMEYFTFSFYNTANEYSLYLDNLMAHYTDDEVKANEKKYQDNEILLFDEYLDRFFVTAKTYMCTPSVLPTFTIERDPKFINSGTGSLKVVCAQSAGNPNWDETPCLEISGEPIDKYDFSTYSKILLKWMPNYDGGRISIRLRNASGETVMFTPVCMDAAIKNEWQLLEIDLNDAKNGFESEWKKVYYPDEDPFVKGIDIETIKAIEIFFGHKVGNILYFDEIKLVK